MHCFGSTQATLLTVVLDLGPTLNLLGQGCQFQTRLVQVDQSRNRRSSAGSWADNLRPRLNS